MRGYNESKKFLTTVRVIVFLMLFLPAGYSFANSESTEAEKSKQYHLLAGKK